MQTDQKILSDITVFLKYAKYNPELKRRETWDEIVTRNKEMHQRKYPMLVDEIEDAYKLVYEKKVLPSMRSLQFGGKPIEVNPSRIYNCAFLPIDNLKAFGETMFLLLGGTGVGYSVQSAHVEKLPEITIPTKKRRFLVGDSIEGWAQAVDALMRAYMLGKPKPVFDFSDIRPKGANLVTSGGKAPGPEPLRRCLQNIENILLRKQNGDKLTTLEVHDIVCYLADAVLAGGIRRAALISLFDIDDEQMLTCKFGNWWELNPQRGRANNSAVVVRHKVKKKDFIALWKKVEASGSGEPGLYFTNNPDWGTNPCCEIALRPFQFCNLCELNGSNIESQEDLNTRAKVAAFIGTLQAGYTDFHYLRDIWKKTTEKDALLGVGITGIASGALDSLDLKQAANEAVAENDRVAKIIGINSAKRITTVN
jgi:ribonucleoside-diphosphate reductase alpha chain